MNELIQLKSVNDYQIVLEGRCSHCHSEHHHAYLIIGKHQLCFDCWVEEFVYHEALRYPPMRLHECYSGLHIAAAWTLIAPDRPTIDIPHGKLRNIYDTKDDPSISTNIPLLCATFDASINSEMVLARAVKYERIVIDGMHRESKAYALGKGMQAYCLTPLEVEFIRIP